MKPEDRATRRLGWCGCSTVAAEGPSFVYARFPYDDILPAYRGIFVARPAGLEPATF